MWLRARACVCVCVCVCVRGGCGGYYGHFCMNVAAVRPVDLLLTYCVHLRARVASMTDGVLVCFPTQARTPI